MKRATTLDALVVNGIGHDEFAFKIVEAAGMKGKLRLIYANDGVALIPLAGAGGDVKIVNPHTFVSIAAAIQQVYTIARALGELDPKNAAYYRDNARTYTTRIRRMKAEFIAQLADVDVSRFSCATMHDAYGYLMQEFGLRVAAVIEPRHGVQPTAKQLAETIDRIKAANVHVLFAEKYFASKLSDSIKAATGVDIYSFSHISDGDYTPQKFEEEMRENLHDPGESRARRERAKLTMRGPAVRFTNVGLVARRHGHSRGRELRGSAGRDPLPHRAERRRQDLARSARCSARCPHRRNCHRLERRDRRHHRLRAAGARSRPHAARSRSTISWR